MPDTAPTGLRFPWETPPAHDAAIEVAPGVLWLRLPLPMKLDHVNVYAFDEGDSWTIIDTGFASKKSKACCPCWVRRYCRKTNWCLSLAVTRWLADHWAVPGKVTELVNRATISS